MNGISNSGNRRHQALLFVSAFLAFCMWFYVDRVWAPPTEMHYSDIYPSWYGTRELLLHHRDPYGPEVSGEIQVWNYGHPLRPGEQKNQLRFAYPLYIGFLLAPVAGLPFSQVVRIFRWILPFLALISSLLWLSMLRWRVSRALLGSLLLLGFGNFPVLESIYLQQPVLLSATFLAGAGACVTTGYLGLAGVLLAVATIKPQLSGLLAAWFLLWAASDWRSRQTLIWGFGLTMLVLLGLSQLLLPRWIPEFLTGIVAYQEYTGNFSLLRLLLGGIGNVAVSVGLTAALGALSWKIRNKPASSREFMVVSCAALTVTVVVMPALYPTYEVVLLAPICLLLREFHAVWSAGRAARLAVVGLVSLVAWPWVAALAMTIASAVVPLTVFRRWWILPVGSLIFVPVSLLVCLGVVMPVLVGSRETAKAEASRVS